jgi:hypothetical protein
MQLFYIIFASGALSQNRMSVISNGLFTLYYFSMFLGFFLIVKLAFESWLHDRNE